MSPVLSIIAMIGLSQATSEPLTLGQSLSLELDAQQRAAVRVPAGALLRLTGDRHHLQIWRQVRGSQGARAELRLPLGRLADDGGGVLIPSSPFHQTTLLIEAGNSGAALRLERVDRSRRVRDAYRWNRLERQLGQWIQEGSRDPPPTPSWPGSELRQELVELALMAQVYRAARLDEQETRTLLHMAMRPALARHRPLSRPWYATETLEFGEPEVDIALPSGTSTYRSLRPGERVALAITGPSIVELAFLGAITRQCARARIDSPVLSSKIVSVGCHGSPTSVRLRLPLGTSTTLAVTSLEGETLVRGSASTRRSRTVELFASRAVNKEGSILYRAEVARLTGELNLAAKLFTQLSTASGARGLAALYAQLRAAELHADAQTALAGLLEVATRQQQPQTHAPPIAEVAVRLALRRALEQEEWDRLAAQLSSAGSLARAAFFGSLPDALTAELLTHLEPGTWREPGVGLLLRAHAATPHRADLARAARRHDRRFGQWRSLPWSSANRTTVFLDSASPSIPVGPLGDAHLLARLGSTGGDIQVIEDPLGLGRWPRIKLAMSPVPGNPWRHLMIDGHPLLVPTLEPIAVVEVAMAPGRHAIESDGAPIYVRSEVAGGPAPMARLRPYALFDPQQPTVATLPEAGLPGSLLLTLRWSHPQGEAEPKPASVEVCMADTCQEIRLLTYEDHGVDPPRVSIRLPVPAAAIKLTIRQTGGSALAIWGRAALRASRSSASWAGPWPESVELLSLDAQKAHGALSAINQAIDTAPLSAPLVAQRAEIWLATDQVSRARQDLRAAASLDRRAALLLHLLGPRGRWLKPGGQAPSDGIRVLAAEQLIEPGPQDHERLAQLLQKDAGSTVVDVAALASATPLPADKAPLATLLYARHLGQRDPIAAASLLVKLATGQPRAAPLLRVEAAKLRLRSQEPVQVRLAYVEALRAQDTPGAATARRQAERLSQWQLIPDVEHSAGVASWKRHKESGKPSTYRGHVATAARPVRVTVLAPTVVRLTLRAVLSRAAPRVVRVHHGSKEVQEITLDTRADPDVQSVHGAAGRSLSRVHRLLIPLAGSAPAGLSVSPDRGQVLVRLAARAARSKQALPTEDETDGELTARRAPSPRDEVIETALAAKSALMPLALEKRVTRERSPSPAALPLTTRAAIELRGPFRDRDAPHSDNEPYLGINARLHRRLADELWVCGGSQVRLRRDAPTTTRILGRVDLGSGPGLRMALGGDAAHQQIAGGSHWGARLRGRAGWELELWSSLALYADLSFVQRWVPFTRLPANHTDVDPLIYSTYARDHQRAIEGRARAIYRPATDLFLRATAALLSNANLGTLDRYRWDVEAFATLPPFYGRIRFRHGRRLADSHRFLPYSVNRLHARAGMALWLGAGHLLAVEVADRMELGDMTHAWSTKLTYTLSWDRRLVDISPALLAHRSQWQDVAPLDEEDPP